jgi:hypothetical protein
MFDSFHLFATLKFQPKKVKLSRDKIAFPSIGNPDSIHSPGNSTLNFSRGFSMNRMSDDEDPVGNDLLEQDERVASQEPPVDMMAGRAGKRKYQQMSESNRHLTPASIYAQHRTVVACYAAGCSIKTKKCTQRHCLYCEKLFHVKCFPGLANAPPDDDVPIDELECQRIGRPVCSKCAYDSLVDINEKVVNLFKRVYACNSVEEEVDILKKINELNADDYTLLINARLTNGASFLHLVCGRGLFSLYEKIIEAFSLIAELEDSQGKTPLYWAIEGSPLDAFLIRTKSVSAQEERNTGRLQFFGQVEHVIHKAALGGDVDAMGADVDWPDEPKLPYLERATNHASAWKKIVADLVMKRNANIKVVSKSGLSLINAAAALLIHLDIFEVLHNRWSIGVTVDAQRNGETEIGLCGCRIKLLLESKHAKTLVHGLQRIFSVYRAQGTSNGLVSFYLIDGLLSRLVAIEEAFKQDKRNTPTLIFLGPGVPTKIFEALCTQIKKSTCYIALYKAEFDDPKALVREGDLLINVGTLFGAATRTCPAQLNFPDSNDFDVELNDSTGEPVAGTHDILPAADVTGSPLHLSLRQRAALLMFPTIPRKDFGLGFFNARPPRSFELHDSLIFGRLPFGHDSFVSRFNFAFFTINHNIRSATDPRTLGAGLRRGESQALNLCATVATKPQPQGSALQMQLCLHTLYCPCERFLFDGELKCEGYGCGSEYTRRARELDGVDGGAAYQDQYGLQYCLNAGYGIDELFVAVGAEYGAAASGYRTARITSIYSGSQLYTFDFLGHFTERFEEALTAMWKWWDGTSE